MRQHTLGMASAILASLPAEEVLHSSRLATMTRDIVVVRNSDSATHTILALASVSRLKTIKKTHPVLLVVASALLLLAAAAFTAKQGNNVVAPFAGLSLVFVAGYFLSRRAAVAFMIASEATETAEGTLSEAAALVAAVQRAATDQPEGQESEETNPAGQPVYEAEQPAYELATA